MLKPKSITEIKVVDGIPSSASTDRWLRRGERMAAVLLDLWDREHRIETVVESPPDPAVHALPSPSIPPLLLTPSANGSLDGRTASS